MKIAITLLFLSLTCIDATSPMAPISISICTNIRWFFLLKSFVFVMIKVIVTSHLKDPVSMGISLRLTDTTTRAKVASSYKNNVVATKNGTSVTMILMIRPGKYLVDADTMLGTSYSY